MYTDPSLLPRAVYSFAHRVAGRAYMFVRSCLVILSDTFPLHKIISLDLQGGEPRIHETAGVGTVSIGTDPFLPLYELRSCPVVS